jgi:thiol-disulfide isomerase/thioredoxin
MKAKNIYRSILFMVFVMMTQYISTLAQTTVVTGKLFTVDGIPSTYALVGIVPSQYSRGEEFVGCDDKGNYSIKLTNPGLQYLLFSIPSHQSLRIPVHNNKDKEFTLNVTLTPYKYKDDFDNLGIAGSFNGFDIRSPEKMNKRGDGTYTIEIKSDEKEVEYQLCGIEKESRTVNAPSSLSYKPDKTGDYYSIIKPTGGKATIIFDPTALLKKEVDYKVVFAGSVYDENIFKYYQEYAFKANDASQKMRAYMEAKNNPQDFHYDVGNYFTELLGRIESEKDQEIKDVLKLLYVSFSTYKPVGYSFDKATSFFEGLSPQNPAWEIMPTAFYCYTSLIPQYKWDEIQNKFLKQSKSSTIILTILSNKLANAKFSGNEGELKKLHTLVLNEYKDRKEALDLLKRFPVESGIKVGVTIPDFEVASISNPEEIYSKKNMLGKIYMIDFWATWCGPCVGEMETLHSAYEKFKDKGFEILSLSADGKPEDVIKFRSGKWKMPWKNGFVGNVEGRKIADKFEVIGIPRPILISAEGKILEMENALRGDRLEITLSKYFK